MSGSGGAIASLDLRPGKYRGLSNPKVAPASSFGVAHTGGGYEGTLANWETRRLNRDNESRDRHTLATRAQDLVANDPHAASVIDGIEVNTIGTGLFPLSVPNPKILGWNEDQVEEFLEQAEWAFSIWAKEADAGGRYPFWAIQSLSIHSLLVNGEYFRIPVMIDDPGRTFSLAIQCVDSLRIHTSTVLDIGSKQAVGNNVSIKVKDGIKDLSPYSIAFRVETNLGNRWELDVEMKIIG